MIWDLSHQNTLFWARMNDHCFCLVSWALCLYDGSLETVGQFCQNKSKDTSWDHSPSVLVQMCAWQNKDRSCALEMQGCKNKALCDQANSGNQISYRAVFLGWLKVKHWTVPRLCVSMFKMQCIISALFVFFEILRKMPVQGHLPRRSFSLSLYSFICTKYIIAKWRLSHMNVSLSHWAKNLGKLASVWF